MAGEVKWIKIATDIFDNRKIKRLRKMPEGSTVVMFWFMLLTLAGKCNADGLVFFTEKVPYTPKTLAEELDLEENTVILALQALQQCDMIEMAGEHLLITGWAEHQNIDGLDKIREQNRIRKRRQREKALLPASRDITGQFTLCHAAEEEGEGDIEGDTEEETDKETEKEQDIKQDRDAQGGGGGEKTGFVTAAAASAVLDVFSCSVLLKEKVKQWVSYKKELGDSYREANLRVLLEKLVECAQKYGEQAVCALIDECILAGWRSIVFQRLERNPGGYQNSPTIAEHTYSAPRVVYTKPRAADELEKFYRETVEWSEQDD